MGKERPKLILQTNTPYRLKLIYNQCLTGNTPYHRDYYLYTVIDVITSIEYIYFACKKVHEVLKAFRQDDEFVIIKKPLEGSVTGFEYEVNKITLEPKTSQEPSYRTSEAVDNWGLKALMLGCINEANEIINQSNDIAVDKTAIALALFEHKKEGLK